MALVNVVVSVGGERELLARAGKDDAEASRERAESRGLINETYVAAADTEMYCKYSISKKNYCPQTRFMSVPLASRRPIFFHSLKQFTLDARFFAHSLDNIRDTNCRYCCT